MNLDKLDTGDILLFNYTGNNPVFRLFGSIIRTITHSNYTHVAMVLKDPTFIHPSLKGLYIWESGWEGTPDPQDEKIKTGVQITSLYEVLKNYQGKLYIRYLKQGREKITTSLLGMIHKTVYNKPYDLNIGDWVGAITRKDKEIQKTDRFWCSALVAYFLVEFGYLSKDIDWSIIRPSDLSSTSNYLNFLPGCEYGDDICIN